MEDQQADGSHQSHRYTDKSREMITQSHCHRYSSEESTKRISQIECRLNAAASEHLATLAMLDYQELFWRTDSEKTGTTDEHHGCRNPSYVGKEESGKQGCSCQELEISGKTSWLKPIGKQGTHLIAYHHTQSCKNHQYRNAGSTEPAVPLQ